MSTKWLSPAEHDTQNIGKSQKHQHMSQQKHRPQTGLLKSDTDGQQ
jgi:hypothetical protein